MFSGKLAAPVLALAAALPAFAQPFRLPLRLEVVSAPPVIDGRLDDHAWQAASVLTDFTQVLPEEGAAPSERTEVRFAHDRDHLYIAVRAHDREPHRIIAKQMQRDNALDSDDRVKIAFDTFFRQRDGYFFAVNAAGARTDGLIENFSVENRLWDTIWRAETRIDESGWTAEIAIPFKSLSFDPRRDTWGFNVERIIRRRQETVRWTAVARAKPMTSLADFAELRGLHGLRQGRGLEVRPFFTASHRDDAVTGRGDWTFKPGGDLTYHLTPSLKANATINTDFAEAEVDDRVVNLTRFPVVFPEKRDFFLQDTSLFSFGGLGTSPTPYYSRRIGLAANGLPVDIVAGARLTGRIGNTSLALLDVQQGAAAGVRAKNLFVGRVSTKVLAESNLGLIVTNGDPRTNGDNTLGGFDFNYLNSNLPGKKQLMAHAYVMVTSSDRLGGEDEAFGLELKYPNEPLDVTLTFRELGARFDPALGFINRNGIRDYIGRFTYTWRPNTPQLRSVVFTLRPWYTTDLGRRVVAENHDLPILTFTNPAGDALTLLYTRNSDFLDLPFAISPGVVIPPGDYAYGRFKPYFNSSPARPVSIGWSYQGGPFYTGTRYDYKGTLDWRPTRHVTAGLGYEWRNVNLREGEFDVTISSGRLNLAFSPDLSWNTTVQYDSVSGQMGLNSRVRYTYRPGSDLFLVVTQGWDFDRWDLRRLNTEIAMKAGAALRF